MDNCRAAPPVVDETTAERQDKALAVVQRLLRERGIRARCQHTISLGLSEIRCGTSPAELARRLEEETRLEQRPWQRIPTNRDRTS